MPVAFEAHIELPGWRLPRAVEIVNVVAALPVVQPGAQARIHVVTHGFAVGQAGLSR